MSASAYSGARGVIPVLIVVFLITYPAQAKYSGGSGTAQDPYRIATAADLIALGETPADYDKHFILTADIDLDPNLPGRKVFDKAIIAPDTDPTPHQYGYNPYDGTPFTGVFDGNGHTISHLVIGGGSYLGLFGYLWWQAEVRDLGVVGVSVTGSGDYVGGLVGYNISGFYLAAVVVRRCYSVGTVRGTGWHVGGLVGALGAGIAQSYSACTVSGDSSVGGLVGGNSGTITQSYSTGTVSGNLSVGGLVGSGSGGGVSGCFWDIETSGQTTSAGGTGRTTAEMQDIRTYQAVGWDFAGQTEDGLHETWQMPQGAGYPVLAILSGYTPPQLQGQGTSESPYLISDAFELGAMAYYSSDAHYRLVVSIDLSGIHWGTAVIPSFGGTFDGNNLTIRGLTIRDRAPTVLGRLGLFGKLERGAEVKDLGVVDVNVAVLGDYVGGLAGYNFQGAVTHCYCTGAVSGNSAVGGLVGCNFYSAPAVITRCYSAAVVTGISDVGGLVGYNRGYVSQSCSRGVVYAVSNVGGLIGTNGRDSRGFGCIDDCYSTGAVNGTECVGGLVGGHGGDVTHCYSSGAVRSTAGPVGGLVGCGFVEAVEGDNPPLPGRRDGATTGSFWDSQASGQTWSDGGTGKTTAEMQTAKTFLDAGWDFVGETANGTADLWWILEGKDYPRLWWETKEP